MTNTRRMMNKHYCRDPKSLQFFLSHTCKGDVSQTGTIAKNPSAHTNASWKSKISIPTTSSSADPTAEWAAISARYGIGFSWTITGKYTVKVKKNTYATCVHQACIKSNERARLDAQMEYNEGYGINCWHCYLDVRYCNACGAEY